MRTEIYKSYPEYSGARLLRSLTSPENGALSAETAFYRTSIQNTFKNASGSDFLWVGTKEEVASARDALTAGGINADDFNFACPDEDADLLSLYSALAENSERDLMRRVRLTEAGAKNRRMRDVINCCADIAEGALFFLNKNQRISFFAGSRCIGSSFAKELLNTGAVRNEDIKVLLRGLGPDDIGKIRFGDDPEPSADVCRIISVDLEQTESFYIALFSPASADDREISNLFGILRKCFADLNEYRLSSELPPGDFQSFMKAVTDGEFSTWDDIDAYAKRLPVPPKRFISIAVIQANPSMRRTSLEGFLARLKAFFPGSEAAILGDYITLMISADDRRFQPRPTFDTAQMQALLSEHDAYVAFSNATQRLDMIRTNYMLAESTLKLGMALRERSTERIFYYEDYAEYISIELSLERFSNLMGHDDILFLTNPDAVKLYRYDQQNGTDLQLVLYYFCKNNGNISAAANDAYMHRNTFASRMSEIRKILSGVDLDDEALQHRLLFSCKVFRYYNLYYDKKVSRSLSERLSVTMQRETEWASQRNGN